MGVAGHGGGVASPGLTTGSVAGDVEVTPGLLADLHDPRLVLSEHYVGTDRRARGLVARMRRATFAQRRSLLSLEALVVVAVAIVGVTSFLSIGSNDPRTGAARPPASLRAVASRPAVAPTVPAAAHGAAGTPPPLSSTAPTPTTTATTAAPTPTTTATTAPAAIPAAAPATPATTPPAPAPAALTPAQMGAEALTLVRYPWQRIPGYTIQFLPIADAPSPGFYGNTTFTWGQAGGTSVLYVYAGETVQRLAAITAFEIGHEVDASAVEPQGGEAQIENVLGIHPASWAPNCDCAEQGFLSGWYAAAFSNYWSPGVGSFSTVAAEPTGAVLTAVQPWLNPTIP